MSTVAENIQRIRERIFASATRAGRSPQEVTLIAVSKTVGAGKVREAIDAGLTIFGENYVQEAREKIQEVGKEVAWHMIGRLQTNKLKYAIPLFAMIQSVESLRMAEELSRRAAASEKVMEVLIEVNLAEEASKGGVSSDRVPALLEEISFLQGIRVKGLMGMPPYDPDPERARFYFRRLRRLRDKLLPHLPDTVSFSELSMGMSSDFEVAIEEGATMVRIGSAIFGERR